MCGSGWGLGPDCGACFFVGLVGRSWWSCRRPGSAVFGLRAGTWGGARCLRGSRGRGLGAPLRFGAWSGGRGAGPSVRFVALNRRQFGLAVSAFGIGFEPCGLVGPGFWLWGCWWPRVLLSVLAGGSGVGGCWVVGLGVRGFGVVASLPPSIVMCYVVTVL